MRPNCPLTITNLHVIPYLSQVTLSDEGLAAQPKWRMDGFHDVFEEPWESVFREDSPYLNSDGNLDVRITFTFPDEVQFVVGRAG